MEQMNQMGTSRRKVTMHRKDTPGEPVGINLDMSPPSNTGGTDTNAQGVEQNQSVQKDRERLNLSLSPKVRETVRVLARIMGMTDSALVAHALMQSLPDLMEQARVVINLTKDDLS
jgi:hypothetical protein